MEDLVQNFDTEILWTETRVHWWNSMGDFNPKPEKLFIYEHIYEKPNINESWWYDSYD